jgi:hypothetical protein
VLVWIKLNHLNSLGAPPIKSFVVIATHQKLYNLLGAEYLEGGNL